MARTIRQSLDSLLPQLDDSFEVVVCDNFSNDGSAEILEEYEAQGKLKLIRARCNRGEGRQIAFNHSQGEYIITGLDMDDTFKPTLPNILREYNAKHSEFMVVYETVAVIPRLVVEKVGGWMPLSAYEDVEFGRRARAICGSKYMRFPAASAIILKRGNKKHLGTLRMLREIYVRAQISYAMNLRYPDTPNPSPVRRKVIAFVRWTAVRLLTNQSQTYKILRSRGTLSEPQPSECTRDLTKRNRRRNCRG